MIGKDIKKLLKEEKDIFPFFQGLFAIDQVPKRIKRHCFIILNKDTIKEQGRSVARLTNSQSYLKFKSENKNQIYLGKLYSWLIFMRTFWQHCRDPIGLVYVHSMTRFKYLTPWEQLQNL
jgi:hypothetical protein